MEFNFDLGQHMLISEEILNKEVREAEIKKSDSVMEIGAGTGNLTKKLAETGAKVTAFEVDERFSAELNKISGVSIVIGNALEFRWSDFDKIVANIPYVLSEEIIMKCISARIKKVVLIVGETFKEKLEGETKIKRITEMSYKIRFVEEIPEKAFDPSPRTKSWLIVLDRKEKISKVDEVILIALRRTGKIKNALLYGLLGIKKTKRESKEIIRNLKLSEQVLEKPVFKITEKLLDIIIERLQKEI